MISPVLLNESHTHFSNVRPRTDQATHIATIPESNGVGVLPLQFGRWRRTASGEHPPSPRGAEIGSSRDAWPQESTPCTRKMGANRAENLRELKASFSANAKGPPESGSALPGLTCDSPKRAHTQREKSRRAYSGCFSVTSSCVHKGGVPAFRNCSVEKPSDPGNCSVTSASGKRSLFS